MADAYARPPALTVLLLMLMAAAFLLAGMWLTLQFRWVQIQHPAVALAFERQVITAAAPVAGAALAVVAAAFVDAGDVPYYLAVALCALYAMMGRPLPSSFHAARPAPRAIGGGGGVRGGSGGGGAAAAPRAALVQAPGDAALLAAAAVALPAASYVAIHWAALLDAWLHLWALLLLTCGPVAVIAALPDGLWWLPGPPRARRGAQRFLLIVAALGLLAGFEGRVVFHAFAPYIKLTPPWSYVAVTAALLGLALLAVAHAAGVLGTALDVTLAGACLLLCTTAGAVAAGVPAEWLPAPLAAAVGLTLYYDSRSVREYGVFVLGAAATLVWFVWHHFWFLDARVGHLRLRTAAGLALAAALPALALPGLVAAPPNAAPRALVGLLLFVQAELVCVLEEQLYSAAALEGPGAEPMYPAYLVLLTSAAGAAAAERLAAARLAPRWAAWVVPALYAAKLAVLAVPEAHPVLPVGLLLLAAAAPAALHAPPPGKRRARVAPWVGLAHAVAITVAAALARFAVFDVVQWASGGRPREGVLLGSLLAVWAAALAPLATRCYAHNQSVVRLVAGVGLLGVAIALLKPPLPIAGGAACPRLPFALCPRLWDARHVPMHEADDAAAWAAGLARREHWPRWLLVAAAALGVAGAAGAGAGAGGGAPRPGARAAPLARLVFGGAAGALVGQYLALEAAPGQEPLQVLILGTTAAVVCFLVLLQNPLLGSPHWLPFVGLGWLGACGFALALQTALPLPDGARLKRLFPDTALSLEDERRAAARALLTGVFAAQAALLAFGLKLRAGAALRAEAAAAAGRGGGGGGGGSSAANGSSGIYSRRGGGGAFCAGLPAALLAALSSGDGLSGPAALAARRLGREGLGWVPLAGNVCAVVALAGGLAVNRHATGGAPEGALLLAPLLLLLGPDGLLLRALSERRRYAPPVAAATLYLAAAGAAEAWGWAVDLGDPGFAALNAGLLLLALPMHFVFMQHVWDQAPRALAPLALLAPPCLAALLLARVEAVRYLGGVGLAMAALLFLNVRQLRQRGMKMI